ncbi:MAG: phosphoglucosamine mutase [Deferribacteres bacterium]|nr:phosphoglucosamine mutase [candidate division KSB1 bacterium]MCB9512007.1 phosphoglucosamine mutase [Deferribacteres bacterium]
MSRLMISISGIRGVIGEGLTPQVAMEVAQAFGTVCNGGTVVVGRDSRVSGEMMHHAVVAGLISVGTRVIDLGICPTPTTQLATENLHASGGIIITASHNPVMWNGIKLLASDGLFLDAEQGEKVLDIRNRGAYNFRSWDQIGHVEKYDRAIDEHIEAVLALPFVNVSQIRARKFKVVADCINGAGAVAVPKLLSALGCDSVIINGTPDGKFSRTPEPLPENLGEVTTAVEQYGADFAVVVDPDADRLALVSEKGEPLGEEYTLALAVDFILQRKRGPVVANVSTTLAIDDLAQKYDSPVERTRVGEINVAKHMREIDAVIGGEGNGGVILPDIHLGRDAFIGITLTLQALAETGKSLSQLRAEMPQYSMVKSKIELADDMDPKAIIARLEEKYAEEKLDKTDGLKILRDKSWVQVRASNTEPIIRVMAEAQTEDEAKALASELSEAALSE